VRAGTPQKKIKKAGGVKKRGGHFCFEVERGSGERPYSA